MINSQRAHLSDWQHIVALTIFVTKKMKVKRTFPRTMPPQSALIHWVIFTRGCPCPFSKANNKHMLSFAAFR